MKKANIFVKDFSYVRLYFIQFLLQNRKSPSLGVQMSQILRKLDKNWRFFTMAEKYQSQTVEIAEKKSRFF